METEFSKFRADILGIRHTLRHEMNSLRVHFPLPSGYISSAPFLPSRSTSNNMGMAAFRDSLPNNFSSHHSSPLSVRSHGSRTDSSPSVAIVLLGSSPHMDSSRVVIDLSLKTMEPSGRIVDYDSSRKFLLNFHRYRQSGGSKKLSTLLQVPLDPKKPLISNFSSLFFEFDDTYLFNVKYIENKILSVYPETLSALNVTNRLRQLCMQETDKLGSKKLIDFLDHFLSVYRYYGSEFKRKYDNDKEQLNKALCKLFCQLICPSDLSSRMNIDGIYNFSLLQE